MIGTESLSATTTLKIKAIANVLNCCFQTFVSESVEIGDIDSNLNTETIREKIRDESLRDSTVTVVLSGAYTWQR